MLAHRIIPTILMKRRLLVKGEGFAADRVVGNALQAAKIHAMRGVDEILMLDVTASLEDREPDYEMIKQLTQTARVPVTVGGGITKLRDVKNLLDSGADKVCVGYWKTLLISAIARRYGEQCVSATLDIRNEPRVGRMAQVLEEYGAGEIIIQSIPRDGTMEGYDLNSIAIVASSVGVPVVASGGCSGYSDMYSAIVAGASGVAAGALFQFTDATPQGAAQYLHEAGLEVRYA